MAVYEIDLLRALFEDRLNDPSIFLASFYEQIQEPEQIERYLENIKELIDLQNRSDDNSNFKAMGIVSQVDQAEIVNIKRNFIVPLSYQVRLDINLSDRDYVLDKIKTLIDDLRGRKFDLIQMANGDVRIVNEPTINTTLNRIVLANNVFVVTGGNDPTTTSPTAFGDYLRANYSSSPSTTYLLFFIHNNRLYSRTFSYVADFGPPPPTFTYTWGALNDFGLVQGRFKISLSFNGVQSQEPYLNNGDDRVFLFFGGNATITDHRVTMGNDVVLQTLQEGKNTGTITTVETTEFPASLAIDDDTFSTFAMGHRTIDRNMKIGNRLSYTFVYDNSISLYNNLYRYARFGTGASTFANLIFTIKEYRYSFGVLTTDIYYAKINEASIQNTNGDVIMLTISFKVGDY